MQKPVIGTLLLISAFGAGIASTAFAAPSAQAERSGRPGGALPVAQDQPVAAAPAAGGSGASAAQADAVGAARARIEAAAAAMNATDKLSAQALAGIEQERAEVLAWIDGLIDVQDIVGSSPDAGGGDRMRELRARVVDMAPQDLHVLRAGMGNDPAFWQVPDLILSVLTPGSVPVPPFFVDQVASWHDVPEGVIYSRRPNQYRIPAGLVGGPQLPSLPGGPGAMAPDAVSTPNATQAVPFPDRTPFPTREAIEKTPDRGGCVGAFGPDDICADCPDSVPLGVVFAAKVAAIVAGGLNDASGTSKMDICAPPGVGFTVPKVWKYAFIGINWATEQLVLALEAANKVAEDCREGFIQGVVDEFVDETVSSRVSQASFDEHADTEMRLAIERNLLRGADENISLFQLPASRCGGTMPQADVEQRFRFCGKLELVREVVADAIDRNNSVAGTVDMNNARLELAAGDMHYMNSQWKSAYARYRNAYIRIVQQSSTP